MDDDKLYDLADLFKMFGDSTRIRIMYALLKKEMSVGEISEALNMTQSAISHQLSILKGAKLVKASRDKQSMVYSLADDHIEAILKTGMEHVEEQ